jgi:hypothetical protein
VAAVLGFILAGALIGPDVHRSCFAMTLGTYRAGTNRDPLVSVFLVRTSILTLLQQPHAVWGTTGKSLVAPTGSEASS